MSEIQVKVPDIGDFKDVAVIELLVKPGDTVKVEQSLITVESDKASMEIPSSHAGVVKSLAVKLGDTVNEGSVVLTLDAAEAAFKIELAAISAKRETAAWALLQVNLARLYEARMDITGVDRGERASAAFALNAALDVFGELGLRSLSIIAADALERLANAGASARSAS